jgi:hypothetical protein
MHNKASISIIPVLPIRQSFFTTQQFYTFITFTKSHTSKQAHNSIGN